MHAGEAPLAVLADDRERQLERYAQDLREMFTHERELADDREQQLGRYAEDLREVYKRERARTLELRDSYAQTVRALANAVEARDPYAGGHAERVAAYGCELALAWGISCGERPELEFGFLLHDVGKLGIPDAILFKPGALSDAETQLMRQHVLIGWEILRPIDWLGEGRSVVRSHHERWDGTGYPDGLQGEEIPRPARVFAVADALDALTSQRPYRGPVSLDEARERIRAESGSQFCPEAIDALDSLSDARLRAIAAR